MNRSAQVIALVEDKEHRQFVLAYLKKHKAIHSTRQIRFEPVPGRSGGAGEQFVRERYASVVRAYRERFARVKDTALIVAIDADTGTVENRLAQLEKELNSANEEPRSLQERIVVLVPRRHIETWVLCLTGEAVDESASYKTRRDIAHRNKPAAQGFFEWSRPNASVPQNCVDSIRTALPEIRRLDS